MKHSYFFKAREHMIHILTSRKAAIVLTLFYAGFAMSASNLSGKIHVDNSFEVYISSDDSIQGTLLSTGSNWPTAYALASSLNAGQDYYLHVKAIDAGGAAGFIGDFEITGTDHTFSNDLATLTTNTSDWIVSKTGWSNYLPVSNYGANGASPWRNRTSTVSSSAQWIWSSNNVDDNVNYFSTKISAKNICGAGSDDNVSELAGYTQVYQLDIPDNANYDGNMPAYSIDNSAIPIDGIDRIGYYMELEKNNSCVTEWVWVSMDAFTQDLGKTGVPVSSTGAVWQQFVENMNVESNVAGVVIGSGISTGNMEFWHHCYNTSNSLGVPGAANTFDFGDAYSGGSCYGSMQIHNYGESQTLFAWNAWDRGNGDDIGIGNRASGSPDWTFASNTSSYSVKNLEVWVRPTENTVPILDYRFDECLYAGVAGDIIDQSGSFNAGTNGIPSPVDDAIINKSLDLSANGTSDWVSVPSSAVDGLDDFTISLWFKTAVQKSQQEILHALGADINDDELELYIKDTNTVVINVKDTRQELNSSITLTNDIWHHLALTRANEEVCLFVDGVEQDCGNGVDIGVLSVSDPNAVVIGQEQDDFGGSFSTAQNFVGQLDEFKIYDVRHSDSAINFIYQKEFAGDNYNGSARDAVQCFLTCGSNTGELNAVGIKIATSSANNQINTTTEALNIYAAWLAANSPETGSLNSAYTVSASGTSTVDRIDFGGSGRDFTGTLAYPGAGNGVAGSDFLVHTSGTLSLPAGFYTIFVKSDDGFSFTMETLSGSDVIFAKFGGSRAGAPNELRFENPTGNSNTGGSFELKKDSIFDIAAIFFERGGGDFLEISIANNVRTNSAPSGYEILREGALNGMVKFGLCASSSQIDHYQIIHNGQGLTCDAETVTINACTNAYDGTCTLSNETLTLEVKAAGTNTVVESISLTGTATASIAYTLAESTLLSIENASITSVNPTVCSDGNTNSCNLVFADAGFRFLNGSSGLSETITNQIAGTSFPLRLQAVKNNNGVCEGVFINDKEISFSQENIDPSGSGGLSFSINGNDIAKYSNLTPITLNFGVDSIATIPIPIYHDAGEIRLHADYNAGGIALSGISNSFWVSPAELVLSASVGTTQLNGASAIATPTHKAGENFDLSVRALNSLGLTTPNYSPGQIQLKLARTGPILSNSVDGALSYGLSASMPSSIGSVFQNVTLGNFAAGVSTFNAAQYSEVGLLNLDVQDSNYGNANIVVSASAINIGRFVPDHFKQTVAQDGLFQATCDSRIAFAAYSGQKDEANSSIGAISYLSNPILAITAYNKQGNITQNYVEDSQGSANDFMKLSASGVIVTLPSEDQLAVGLDTTKLPLMANMNTGILSQNDLTALPNIVALPKGVVHYQLSDNDNFFYIRSANALVSPFTSDIDFAITMIRDTDNVNSIATVDASPTGVEIRFGRLVLENSFGPETSNFAQAMQLEHYDGTDFTVSSDNNCSTYDASKMSLTNISLDPALTSILGGTGSFLSGKSQAIELASPGAGNQGQIGVSYDAYDWLKYDWDNDSAFDNNPSAVAAFGLYRADDRLFHWRETF